MAKAKGLGIADSHRRLTAEGAIEDHAEAFFRELKRFINRERAAENLFLLEIGIHLTRLIVQRTNQGKERQNKVGVWLSLEKMNNWIQIFSEEGGLRFAEPGGEERRGDLGELFDETSPIVIVNDDRVENSDKKRKKRLNGIRTKSDSEETAQNVQETVLHPQIKTAATEKL
jgi:hypothetical protein